MMMMNETRSFGLNWSMVTKRLSIKHNLNEFIKMCCSFSALVGSIYIPSYYLIIIEFYFKMFDRIQLLSKCFIVVVAVLFIFINHDYNTFIKDNLIWYELFCCLKLRLSKRNDETDIVSKFTPWHTICLVYCYPNT